MRRARVLLFFIAAIAGVNEGCDCGSENEELKENGCGYDCKQACSSALGQGVIGGYTSIVTGADGTLYVAGYSDAVKTPSFDLKYGDLVYGPFNRAKGAVEWRLLDGVPSRTDDSCPTADRKGFRGGEDNAGDNVGLWTSIQLDPRGRAMIAYHDYTHRTLRFARVADDVSSYALTEEKKGFDAGRFAKQIILAGRPVIVYAASEPGDAGKRRSVIRVARSLSDFPGRASDWQFEDILANDDAGCLFDSCAEGSACVKSTGVCSPIATGCAPECKSSSACITQAGQPVCVSTEPEKPTAYPRDVGSYLKVASSVAGLAVVAYDRIHGDLLGLSNADGTWKTTILDGADSDAGLAPTVSVDDNGDWHVAYVNLSSGALQYLRVIGGKTAGKPEIVDNASGLNGTPFADGLHEIGDDAEIRLGANGLIEILYQDATSGTLRYAKGVPAAGDTHTWTLVAAIQPGRFAGFFPHWVPGTNDIVNFWRATNGTDKTIDGNVALVPAP